MWLDCLEKGRSRKQALSREHGQLLSVYKWFAGNGRWGPGMSTGQENQLIEIVSKVSLEGKMRS